ncbi:Hypothetical protein KNT65_gp142 [Escherichia phage EcS1]|uniref:Uncharacterized protein n=1 Tax=Escherichia phage EcS1 TaxID=2083276 RepID=A0A2Z5ZC37_9CAUD|nr:Hypothetical protein KNT65_gp142 [Escherichia phage EcS1]BBC78190.1 Hypothetical protein [Escherichia phage EcS1]
MIKTIYRGYRKSSYNEEGWVFFFILVLFGSTAIAGFGTYYTLFFFSPIFGSPLLFLAIAAAIITFSSITARWVFFVGQVQRGTFDVVKPKIVKETKPSKKDEALDFIKGIRS